MSPGASLDEDQKGSTDASQPRASESVAQDSSSANRESKTQSFDDLPPKYRKKAAELFHILTRLDNFELSSANTVVLNGKSMSIALMPLFHLLLVPNQSVSHQYHESDVKAFLTFMVKKGLGEFIGNENLTSLFPWYYIGK